ncbi:MAG TPA: phosphatase PAP2 family protein [Nitrospira sp.]|nr:phosphatase PAP2 family protein [Nitrospira sp.]
MRQEREEKCRIPLTRPDVVSRMAAGALFSFAGLSSFWGLFEWDVPLTKFIRSLYHPIGYLPNPWLAQLSNSGDQLGKGESLAALSLVVLAAGFLLKREGWKAAGWQTLVAHGIAALFSNLLKHLIGRPRPKFMHSGYLHLSPASGSGWDSFPSGHATATFAVAAVLAVRFPKMRGILFAAAVAIAASRVLRGSHYLTDVVGGAVLGYVIGTCAAHPWREWRLSVASALIGAAPFLAGLLALIWTMGHQASDASPSSQVINVGIGVTLLGLGAHIAESMKIVQLPSWLAHGMTETVIGFGLGMTTGSLWVAVTIVSLCLAYSLRASRHATEDLREHPVSSSRREAVFSLLVLLALLATVELRGALPMG